MTTKRQRESIIIRISSREREFTETTEPSMFLAERKFTIFLYNLFSQIFPQIKSKQIFEYIPNHDRNSNASEWDENQKKNQTSSRFWEHWFCTIIIILKSYNFKETYCSINTEMKYFFFVLNEFVNFSQCTWIFLNLLAFLKISFATQIQVYNRETVCTILRGKFLSVTWNFVTITYPKFVMFRSLFEIKINQIVKKAVTMLFIGQLIFYQVNKFSDLLLCKINVLEIFKNVDIFF